MAVRIQFDHPHDFYTNLDEITGSVILNLQSDEIVSAIIVKLEGESKTMLIRPPPMEYSRRASDRNRPANEYHKILYKLQQVFPSGQNNFGPGFSSGAAYTLRPGQHHYPFRFKIPFNNSCSMMGPVMGVGGIKGFLDMPQQFTFRHVTRTLPPSLSGFPNEAEIRYFVKVTVQRPGLFKENRRTWTGFKFLPIEPPRPPPTTQERFARRTHTFQAGLAPYANKSMFSKKVTPASDTPPSIEVNARLPNPPILTCNKTLPLRILTKKLNDSPESVYLTSLQIELLSRTEVRAEEVMRVESGGFVIMTAAGLSIKLSDPGDAVGKETVLDSSLWVAVPLPKTVTPSFHTCNLTRTYELEVKVGLAYGNGPKNLQPQQVQLPLRFPVDVYSGIAPPPGLVDAMASRPGRPPAQHPRPGTSVPASAPAHAPKPPAAPDPLYPPQLGTPAAAQVDEAPPSYEDAMAEEFTSQADGNRAAYSGISNENGPSQIPERPAPQYEEKGGGILR